MKMSTSNFQHGAQINLLLPWSEKVYIFSINRFICDFIFRIYLESSAWAEMRPLPYLSF